MNSKKKDSPDKNRAIKVTVDIHQANLVRSTQKYMPTIIANEQTVAKLENLESKLKLHLELIEKNLITVFLDVSIPKIVDIINLEWPDSLKLHIKNSLIYKTKEIISHNKYKAKDLTVAINDCLTTQQSHISRLYGLCEILIEKIKASSQKKSKELQKKHSLKGSSISPKVSKVAKRLRFVLPEDTKEDSKNTERKLHKSVQEIKGLKDKLLSFQSKNIENVIYAEDEFKRLNRELILSKTRQIELEEIVEFQQRELEILKTPPEKIKKFKLTESSLNFCRLRLLARNFRMMKSNCRLSRKLKYFRVRNSRSKEICKVALAGWKWIYKFEKMIRCEDFKKKVLIIKSIFKSWR